MMAHKLANGQPAIGYNALEVGTGGRLLSEFVFWHEVGHHQLGHTGALDPGQMEGVQFTNNNELDADRFSFQHWTEDFNIYGLSVVDAAIKYFDSQGSAPGDAAHPAPSVRSAELKKQILAKQIHLCEIFNDNKTPPNFVLEVLKQCFLFNDIDALSIITSIENIGSYKIRSKGDARKSKLIDNNEALKISHFIKVKKLMVGDAASDFKFQFTHFTG